MRNKDTDHLDTTR